MKKPVVLVGVGEMGAVFARGFLRLGHPVHPVTRGLSMSDVETSINDPELVLIAVGEKDLPDTLTQIPEGWKSRIALLQNELLPDDWNDISNPTVISVWFEKKKGMDSKVIIPSPAYGPKARLLADALGAIDIPVRVLDSAAELLFELVVKNLYILTSNIAGLRVGGNVGQLWTDHETFARDVVGEVISIQEALTDNRFDHEKLIQAMVDAFMADKEHKCMGRSAPARLQRALEHAERLGLDLPALRELQTSSD